MLKAEEAALVVVDVQGKLATLMHDKENFYDNVIRMIRGAHVLGIPTIWNEQLPDKLGPTIDRVKVELSGKEPLIKKTFSCCGNPSFVSALQQTGRKQVLLVGMESHVCVYQSARDLLAQGYEVFVIADAISSRNPDNKEIGLQAMVQLGAHPACVEMVLLDLVQVAEGDRFRKVLQIIK
mgnify:CR=1 FL=1